MAVPQLRAPTQRGWSMIEPPASLTPAQVVAPEIGSLEVVDVARAHEPERYLAATLAAEPHRPALIALAAFAADLVRISHTVTQPILGEIRLQWWRDNLDIIDRGGRAGSPIADALAPAITSYELPLPLLVAMTEARAFDLYDDPMPDEPSLAGYLSKTEAIPFELALRILGVAAQPAASLAISAGRAFGLTRLLAELPRHLAAGRVPLPLSIINEHGISPASLREGGDLALLRPLITHLTREVSTEIAMLRPRIAALSRQQRVALLPLAVLSPYLKAIERPLRNPVRDVASLAPLTRAWRVVAAHILGRI